MFLKDGIKNVYDRFGVNNKANEIVDYAFGKM